jgi:hypothetical protein
MAKSLQCPSCGTKTRLDGVDTDTFRCDQCGQVLKVPPTARRPAASAAAGVAGAAGAAAGAGPPPRRRPSIPDDPGPSVEPPPRPTPSPVVSAPVATPPVVAAGGGTAVLANRDGPPIAPPPATRRGGAGRPPRDSLPLALRLGAWALAVPIGLAIVGIPARVLGYLTSQKLLDVFVKHTLARFVPLLVIVVLWALATTVLVEIFVEGGRWFMLRRRRGAMNAPDTFATDAPSQAPAPSPPPRRGRRSRRSRGKA